MKKADMRGVRPFIKDRPIIGRAITAALLLCVPIAWPILAMKETWPDVRDEVKQMAGVIFLPWGDES